MHPAVGPAFVTFVSSLVLGGYVLLRRRKEPLHWALVGFLTGLALWTGGILLRFNVYDPDSLAWAIKIVFTGIGMSGACWLLAAVCYVRPASWLRLAVPLVVSGISAGLVLAVHTNESHGLFMGPLSVEALAAGPSAWAGPLWWAFVAWVYVCVGAGLGVYLRAARSMMRSDSRRRGTLLALAAAVPLATSTLYVFQLLPVHFDLTPTSLMFSMLLLCVVVFRYQLFESLPLARGSLIAHLEDAVVMASARGRVTEWNPAAERILSDPELAAGSSLGDLIARLLARVEAPGLAGWEVGMGAPTLLHMTDGRVLEVTAGLVDEGHGEPVGQFVILSDRTDVHRMEKLARQAQRLEVVGSLASDVAQEIDDPLSHVRETLVEIEQLGRRVEVSLGADDSDAELAQELADLREVALETLEGVDRMRRIVDDMRGLSAGSPRDVEAVDMGRVVRDAVRLAQLGGSDTDSLVVGCNLDDLPPVRGNADGLVQVVLNLLVNARQALQTTEAARIDLTLTRDSDSAELEVRDNGPGIPASVRHRIFDPFFTTRGPDEGTGLGLALAFDTARDHGGLLEERSKPGQGACFALRLPLALDASPTGTRPDGEENPPGDAGSGGEVEVQ